MSVSSFMNKFDTVRKYSCYLWGFKGKNKKTQVSWKPGLNMKWISS